MERELQKYSWYNPNFPVPQDFLHLYLFGLTDFNFEEILWVPPN